jgi:hypothetical protein
MVRSTLMKSERTPHAPSTRSRSRASKLGSGLIRRLLCRGLCSIFDVTSRYDRLFAPSLSVRKMKSQTVDKFSSQSDFLPPIPTYGVRGMKEVAWVTGGNSHLFGAT